MNFLRLCGILTHAGATSDAGKRICKGIKEDSRDDIISSSAKDCCSSLAGPYCFRRRDIELRVSALAALKAEIAWAHAWAGRQSCKLVGPRGA